MSDATIQGLGQLGRDLDKSVTALDELETKAARAETAFKVAEARAYMNADGPVDARKAQATITTEHLRDEYEGAAAAVRVQRARIRALHARIDIGRSIFSAEKALAGVS